MTRKNLDWADTRYRPKTFDELVGNVWAFKQMRRFAEDGNFPHLLLAGPPGTGKSASAEILAKSIGAEFKEWNASDKRKIDDIRNEIKPFAMVKTITGKIKVAFLDECEGLRKQIEAQNAFRRIMEKFSQNCRFILSTNELYAIIYQIRSRCKLIKFKPIPTETIYDRLVFIGEKEEILDFITQEQVQRIAETADGDLRVAIKTLQGICGGGRKGPVTDEEITSSISQPNIDEVGKMIVHALNGNFTEACKIFQSLCFWNTAEGIFEVIIKEFPLAGFKDVEKRRIAMSLGNLQYRRGKEEMLKFLAEIGG